MCLRSVVLQYKIFRMAQPRGRGRVVPRQSKAQGQQQAAGQTVVSHFPRSTTTLAGVQSNTNSHETANKQTKSLVASSGTDSSSDWRCADYVVSNSKPVQQLPASKLASGSGQQILTSGEPVLLKNLQLARCSLKQTASHNAPKTQQAGAPDAHSSSSSSVPAHQQQQGHQHAQAAAGSQVSVLCSPAGSNRFIAADCNKNLPGSYYHVRKPETSVLQMTFDDWLDCWQAWSTNRLLLQAHVCNFELSGTPARVRLWPNKAVYPHTHKLLNVTPLNTSPTDPNFDPGRTRDNGSGIATVSGSGRSNLQQTDPAADSSVQHILDWALLQQLLQDGHWTGAGSLQLLAGSNDALLPARYDTADRLLVQVAGRQRVVLLPPGQAFRGVYPYPVHHPYDGYSAVDWEDPELDHWPAAAQVQGLLCELTPGDSLLVPAYWFMQTQLSQPACVSLQLQLNPQPSRLNSPQALQLQCSRMVEVWFGAEAGPANTRKWMQALAGGREWQLLEPRLLTPQGYKLLQCCHMTLQQLQKVLALDLDLVHATGSNSSSSSNDSQAAAAAAAPAPAPPAAAAAAAPQAEDEVCSSPTLGSPLEAAACQLVGLMCEGRLMPTTWLNEGITDPLYLQHPPQYYLIEEDAEALRYSSLFRHRLIANRPDWQQHATPLQLAPAGSAHTLIKAAAAAGVQALPAPGQQQQQQQQ